jgi:hypothetical protein
MIRVPLALRGVAVVLFAASTAFGQTVEPPAELPADPRAPASPDLMRDYSTESRHPLLNWMTEGELTSFDTSPAKESSRLQPKPQASEPSKAAETEPADSCSVEIDCPTVPNYLPFACPPPQPPCHGHKWHRKHKHSDCGYGAGYGNPYLGWPCAMCGYGGGYAPSSPYQGCGCRKCQRKHHHGGQQSCGYQGCGYPYGGYAGGCGPMGCGGFMDEGYGDCCSPFMAPPPPPQCHCRKCQRKHHGSSGYGYAGCNYPGWPAYPVPGASMVDGGYNGFTDPNCFGCGKHQHCHGLFHHCRACHHKTPPYPYCAYPMMMNSCCMQEDMFCSDCSIVADCSPPPTSSSGTKK